MNLIDANWLPDLIEFFMDKSDTIAVHGLTSLLIALTVAFVLDNTFEPEYTTK